MSKVVRNVQPTMAYFPPLVSDVLKATVLTVTATTRCVNYVKMVTIWIVGLATYVKPIAFYASLIQSVLVAFQEHTSKLTADARPSLQIVSKWTVSIWRITLLCAKSVNMGIKYLKETVIPAVWRCLMYFLFKFSWTTVKSTVPVIMRSSPLALGPFVVH